MGFPARTVPAPTELAAYVEAGLVRACMDEAGLTLYCYTQRAFYAGIGTRWDGRVAAARGLVYAPDGRLLCLPFPKFSNVGEHEGVLPHTLPKGSARITEKLDGSMIAVWHDGQRWRTSTKGAFASPQAVWARQWMEDQIDGDALDVYRGRTLLFEALYPKGTFEDDLVVDYGGRTGLVLLAAYDVEARRELAWSAVDDMASALGVPRPSVHPFTSVEDALGAAERIGLESEGYVVQFTDGLRVKVKGSPYRLAVKALSGATRLAFWEALAPDGRVPPSVLAAIPAERRDDIEPLVREIEADYAALRTRVDALVVVARSRPEGRLRAEWVKAHAGPLAGAVFSALAGQGDRSHGAIHRLLRPAGNVRSRTVARLLDRPMPADGD